MSDAQYRDETVHLTDEGAHMLAAHVRAHMPRISWMRRMLRRFARWLNGVLDRLEDIDA